MARWRAHRGVKNVLSKICHDENENRVFMRVIWSRQQESNNARKCCYALNFIQDVF
jgi:hypothetical protein